MSRMLRFALGAALLLVIGLGARARPAHAQTLAFSGTMVNDSSLVLDSNAPCTDGPRTGYIAFTLTNNTGSARTGVYVDLIGFANGLALSQNQAQRQYIGNWSAGQTRTLYWFIDYPCSFGASANLTARVTDGTGNYGDVGATVKTTAMLSSNGGGQLISGSIGSGAVVGQILTADVQYSFGGVGAGDTYSLQASGTLAHNAQCFQLVKTEIIQSQITAIPVGTVDRLFFTAAVRQSGTNLSATMRYYFKYLCVGSTSYLQPYTNQLSGQQLKYSGNWSTFIGPTLPAGSNPYTVSKTVSPSQLATGGTVTYSVVIRNTSSFTSSIDSIADALPAGVTYTGLSAASGVTAANSSSVPTSGSTGTIKFRGAWTVAGGDSLKLVYTATVTSTAGQYTNTATAYAGISVVGTSSATVTVGSADISATKTGPTTVVTGDSIKYILTLSNLGTATSYNVVLVDSLPASVTFVRASRTPTLAGRVLTWPAIASMASGATRVDTVVVTAPALPGSITNSVSASAGTIDPTPTNNNGSAAGARVTTTVAAKPDLTVSKTSAASFTQGVNAVYTLKVTNIGLAATSGNTVVRDSLPAGLTYVSGASVRGTWTFNVAGQIITATTTGAIAVNDSAKFTITAAVGAAAVPSVTNLATVSGGGEVNLTNDTTVLVTPVAGIADLTVAKTASALTQYSAGSYTITVTNSGTAMSGGTITVTDTLPAGMTYSSGSGSGWSFSNSGQVVTATYTSALAVSGTAAFTLNVAVGAAATSVTNRAWVAGGGDAVTTNNSGSVTTSVAQKPDLTVTKTSSASFAYGATNATYTITVRNSGSLATTGTITITDTLPAGITYLSKTGGNWTVTWDAVARVVTATSTTAVNANSNAQALQLTVSVGAAAYPSVTNTAYVTGGGELNTTNNTASVTTPVTAPDLTLTKTSSASFSVGTNGTYTLKVTNIGAVNSAGSITVRDTLPAGIGYVSVAGGSWASPTGGTTTDGRTWRDFVYSGANLAATTGTTSATVTVSVAIAAAPSVTNTAYVSGGGEVSTSNNSSSVTTPVNGADLAITKTSAALFTPGSTGSYTISVQNVGATASSGTITVKDTLPAGLTLTTVASPQNSWTIASVLDATLQRYVVTATYSLALAANATTSFTFAPTVGTAAMPSVRNKAYVSGGNQYNAVNDTSAVTTAVASPDLTIAKVANGAFTVGTPATYTITVTNSGTYVSAGSIVVTDTLAAGLTFNAAGSSGTNWTFTSNGQVVTATFSSTLAANGGATSLVLGVNILAAARPSVSNIAYVSGGNDKTLTNNSSGTITTTINGVPSLTLAKSVTPTGPALPGAVLTYNITFVNGGSADAVNVVISDPVPAQMQFKLNSIVTSIPNGITANVQYFDGTAWTYTPVDGGCGAATGYDGCVQAVRWSLQAPLPAGVTGNVWFSGKVK